MSFLDMDGFLGLSLDVAKVMLDKDDKSGLLAQGISCVYTPERLAIAPDDNFGYIEGVSITMDRVIAPKLVMQQFERAMDNPRPLVIIYPEPPVRVLELSHVQRDVAGPIGQVGDMLCTSIRFFALITKADWERKIAEFNKGTDTDADSVDHTHAEG